MCSACGAAFQVLDQRVGTRRRCPACPAVVQLSALHAPAAAAPAAPGALVAAGG